MFLAVCLVWEVYTGSHFALCVVQVCKVSFLLFASLPHCLHLLSDQRRDATDDTNELKWLNRKPSPGFFCPPLPVCCGLCPVPQRTREVSYYLLSPLTMKVMCRLYAQYKGCQTYCKIYDLWVELDALIALFGCSDASLDQTCTVQQMFGLLITKTIILEE